jgi:hypothetical protein
MASREYSKRLGTISDEQLQAALDRFGLGRLLAAESAEGGLFGQNVLLETTDGRFVFRGAPHWNPAGEDDWQFQKERYFSRLVHEATGGPPVPWPYEVEPGREIFGWGYAIQPRLAGSTLTQPLSKHYSGDEVLEQFVASVVLRQRLCKRRTREPRLDRVTPAKNLPPRLDLIWPGHGRSPIASWTSLEKYRSF